MDQVRSEREGRQLVEELLQRAALAGGVAPQPRLRIGRGVGAHVSQGKGRAVVTVGRDALSTYPDAVLAWKIYHEVGHIVSRGSAIHRRNRRWDLVLGLVLVLYGAVLLAGVLTPAGTWPLAGGIGAVWAIMVVAALAKCSASRACEIEADQWAARNGAPMTDATVALMAAHEPKRWPVLFRTHPAPKDRQGTQWEAGFGQIQ